MQSAIQLLSEKRGRTLLIIGAVLAALSFMFASQAYANDDDSARNGRLVTIHDRGEERVVLTHADSVRGALADAKIDVIPQDTVEPAVDTELVATNYTVNIYRARPIIVIDGAIRQKVVTAAQTPGSIVHDADITALRDEDKATFSASTNIVSDGASTILTVDRAVEFTLQLYGKPIQAYSHADTVGEMLAQKGIVLAPEDTVSVDQAAPLKAGMTVAIWRDGVQTATVQKQVAFPVREIIDLDRPVGYHEIKTPGVKGTKSVTYEITAQDGKVVKRKVIQSVMITKPKEQVEVIGAKPGPNALTKSKGAQYWTDSKGVNHRETYYDLNMSVVMGACGGGGYSVRADGAKVDRDGYILVAANLTNYPKCTIVETSMGLGKVYDTGGFAARHPHGFDLATDWSNGDGR